MKKYSKGFTLIELLVVIGILAVLLAITLIAINPARQFAQSNNTKRRSDVNAILNAINQYMADNRGVLPPGIDGVERTITNDPASANFATSVDLCAVLVAKYIAALPVDPQTNAGAPVPDCTVVYDTNYTVLTSATDNRLTVATNVTELGEPKISVTR